MKKPKVPANETAVVSLQTISTFRKDLLNLAFPLPQVNRFEDGR